MRELERAVRRFARGRQRTELPADGDLASMGGAAFRALVAERLRVLDRDVGEVRARVNSVLFVVAGAVITQLVLRLLA
jgi:hypothetical protein